MSVDFCIVGQVPIDEITSVGTKFAFTAAVDRPMVFSKPLMLIDISLELDGRVDDAVVAGLRECILP